MKSRTTLLLVVLALLVGGVVLLDHYKGTTTSEVETQRKRLVDFKSDDVTHFELAHTNQTIVIDKIGERWQIKQPLTVRASASAVSSILGELEFAERERTLSQRELGGVKLADFGLAPARLRLTLRDKKHAVTLLVGGGTPTKDGLYVQIDGRPDICVINKGAYVQLDKSLDDLRERELFEFSPAATTRLEIKSAQRSIELLKSATATNAEPRWAISRPLAARADQNKVSELFTALSELRVADFVSEDPKDVHTYGLDEPEHEISVWSGAGDAGKTLLLGRVLTNDASKVYAKLKGVDSIVTVPAGEAHKFAMQVNDLRDHRILNLAATDVRGIELQRGSDVLALARDDKSWKVAGVVAEDAVVDQMLSQIVNLNAKEFTADVAADLDKFGLAPPPLTVMLRNVRSNVVAQLLFSADNPPSALRYVKRADEAFVYGIETNALSPLPARPLDVRVRRIADIKPDTITKLTLQRATGTVVLERAADKSWRLVEPTQGVLDNDALNKLLDAIGALRAQEFVREGLDDLAEYGLDKPELGIIVQAAGKTWTLAIGKSAPFGMQYASWSDPGLVFTLPMPTVATLTKTLVTTPAVSTTNAPAVEVVTPPPVVEPKTR